MIVTHLLSAFFHVTAALRPINSRRQYQLSKDYLFSANANLDLCRLDMGQLSSNNLLVSTVSQSGDPIDYTCLICIR